MPNKLDTRKKLDNIRSGGLNRCVCASVLSVLCVLPSFGATNPQITKLIKEKQQKYAQLEECTKKVTGFKIAGISTLGLTAVGIGGNIALASKNKQLDKQINGTNGEGGLRSDLTKEQEKLEQKNAEISAEKLKIQQKRDCDAKGNGWRWTGTGCDPKPVVTASNSGAGNSNQSGSTTTQTDTNATVAQSDDTKNKIYEAIYALYEKYESSCGVTYPFLSDSNDEKTKSTMAKLKGCKLTDKAVNDCMKVEGLSETSAIFGGVGIVCKVCTCQG